MTATPSLVVVVLAALYLVGLGIVALVAPARAGRFLLGFAATWRLHALELALRLVVGAALVLHAPRMALGAGFAAFGWLLIATTAAMMVVPWRWHQRFAGRFVPVALRHTAAIGLVSLALGLLLLAAALPGVDRAPAPGRPAPAGAAPAI
jgi:hypothetical protein